jgi:hypothetical protein
VNTRNKRIAVIAAAGLLAGGGIAGAFAATSGGDDPSTDLANALSQETGTQVSAAQVKAAFQDVLKQRLDKDVAAGRITQNQADQILKQAADNPGALMRGPGDHGHRGGPGGEARQAVEAAVQKALGVDEAAIHQARESGKSLADLATEKGVSRDDLTAAIAAAIKSTDRGGSLTDAQATQMANNIVDGKGGPARGMHRAGNGAVEKAITSTLGITEAQWHADRRSGKSAAEVAKSKGIEVSKVVDAVTTALQKNAPQGAAKLTDAQAKAMATHIVNNQDMHGPGGRGDHRGPGGPGGPPPVGP